MVDGQRKIEMTEASDATPRQGVEAAVDIHQTTAKSNVPPTIASRLGEMVWLLTQSPAHKHFSIGDLEWMLMPPLMLGQYKLYYKDGIPIALALWAYLKQEDEDRLLNANRLKPEAWCGGEARWLTSSISHIGQTDEAAPFMKETQLWLIELIAPAANDTNKLREMVLADLMSTVLKGRAFKLQITDPVSGRKEIQEVGGV